MGRIRSAAAELRWSARTGGLRASVGCALTQIGITSRPWRVKAPSAPAVRLRFGTADITVFEQVFQERQYAVDLPRNPRLILDAGAHIGLASAYFAVSFPSATVLAIEPHPANFGLLERNTADFANVTAIRGALSDAPGTVEIANPESATWGYRVRPRGENSAAETIRAYTVPELLELAGEDHADLLKIDIEGEEGNVFRGAASWIDSVGAIVAELHDDIDPGATKAFDHAVAGFGHRWATGDVVWASRNPVARNRAPA
jgi:FkbM family methyltransferase